MSDPIPPPTRADLKRKLVYRFLELPYVVRMDIVRELGLSKVGDSRLSDQELWTEVFRRASDRSLLADMRNLVDKYHAKES